MAQLVKPAEIDMVSINIKATKNSITYNHENVINKMKNKHFRKG